MMSVAQNSHQSNIFSVLHKVMMRWQLAFWACLFLMPMQAAHAVEEGFADLAEKLMPSVVNISISTNVERGFNSPLQGSPFQDFFEDFLERHTNPQDDKNGPPQQKQTSLGSGFVIAPEGIIITNNHVIENADKITVNFSNGDKLDAELIGRDVKTDIAVLKVETDKPLPYVSFGDSTRSRVGDWVIAIGNPFGLGGSLSAGVISAMNRDINAGPYDSFIQTDAAINRGNSGGPLFNMQGEVIGVNTAIISPTGGSVGIGFAIPADMALPVIEQLRAYGETRRGWLGVRIQTVTEELAESLGMSKPRGALISEVTSGGPAEEAGLKQGDVILRFDRKEVAEMRDLPRIVAETEVNKKVQVEVLRRGKVIKKTVTVGRLDESQDQRAEAKPKKKDPKPAEKPSILGMQLAPLTEQARAAVGLKASDNGVLIDGVETNSAAALAGLRRGFVIAELDQNEVTEPQDVVDIVKKAQSDGKKSVLVLLKTANGLRFVALRVTQD